MAAKFKSDWLHKAISWGASIVIIGVLFKILHIGGSSANLIIGVGLGIEAILFFITGFFPPAPDPAWDRVYPELSDDFTGELPKASAHAAMVNAPAFSPTAALDKMMADAAQVTHDFTMKMRESTAGFDRLNQAFHKSTAQLVEMGDSMEDSKQFKEEVGKLGKNLASLNAIYGNMLSAMNQPRV